MSVKCLVEVEFTGPNAAQGPQVLVNKSNEMSQQNGGIPIMEGCLSTTYKLIGEYPQNKYSSIILHILIFILGLVLCGLYMAY